MALEYPIGEMFIEAARPRDPDSPAGRFLGERNGVGGMHHIAFASTDVAADVAGLQRQGVRVLGPVSKGNPVFLDPATTLGLLIQIRSNDEYYPHPSYRGAGLATGMAHIGVAARSAEEVRRLFGEAFGFAEDKLGNTRTGRGERETRRREAADDDVTIVEFPVGGTVIEISIPNDNVSGTARFLAQRGSLGAAWHHICPFAPDVHAFMNRGTAAGLQQIGTIPSKESGERAVGWFHPRSALGTLIEVWDRPPHTS